MRGRRISMWTTGTRIPTTWPPAPSRRARRDRDPADRPAPGGAPGVHCAQHSRDTGATLPVSRSSSKRPRGWSAGHGRACGRRADVRACVYQSRSGRPEDPWLGPDVSEYLTEARKAGPSGGRALPHRLRLRSHRDPVRPRRRGGRGLPLDRAAHGARGSRERPSAVSGDDGGCGPADVAPVRARRAAGEVKAWGQVVGFGLPPSQPRGCKKKI